MEKIWVATKKGRRECRRGGLSDSEMKVVEFLTNSRSATMDQLEVAKCEPWLVRSMGRKGLIKEKEE